MIQTFQTYVPCAICNFALVALANAPDEHAAQKASGALAQHLSAAHKLSNEDIAARMAAAREMVR